MKPAPISPILKTLCACILALAAPCILAQNYTIPVVVHVLWNSPMQNIPDGQILSGLDILNNSFNTITSEPVDTPYNAIAANVEIEFCLATIAPDGTSTTGIDRIETPLAMHGGVQGSYLNQWPPDRYLNIWVIAAPEFGVYQFGSFLPEDAETTPYRDGIMIRNIDMGYSPVYPSGNRGIALMAGRYLGLKLLWEDAITGGPCGDDDVNDTPPCREILICSLPTTDSCAGDLPVMVENYMTYSYCGRMFTLGQKDRIYAALNSSVAQRNDLWSSNNLGLAGCGPVGINELASASSLSV
ncbi:MAG: M43 family zinc metalloprotease, partial [Flavobacteriales bacterium]